MSSIPGILTSITFLHGAAAAPVIALLAAGGVAVMGAADSSGMLGTSDAVRIEVRIERLASRQVVYHYRAISAHSAPVAEIQLGLTSDMEEPALAEGPVGWDPDADECPSSIRVPDGWTGCVGRQEESSRVFLMIRAGSDAAQLLPGAALRFSVTLARADTTYETTRFTALTTAGPPVPGRVERAGDGR